MEERMIREIVEKLLSSGLSEDTPDIPVEISARHVHLSQEDVAALFGAGHALTAKRELSQPGQYLCEERVKLVTPKGEISSVAVLGPARSKTQVELSAGDARQLGISPPLRLSGNLTGAADLVLVAAGGAVNARGSAIIAQNHIHMNPQEAAQLGVRDGLRVRVSVQGARSLAFEGVPVRVNPGFRLAMHIDVDEANACLLAGRARGRLLSRGQTTSAGVGTAADIPPAPAPSDWDWAEGVITEAIAKKLCATGKKRLLLPMRAILTPLAMDILASNQVTVERMAEGRAG